jgi:hypothetical protein
MARTLTDCMLVELALSNLRRGPHTTQSDSTHSLDFRGPLVYWSAFEGEVRNASNDQEWNGAALDTRP